MTTTRGRTITEADVVAFSALTGDHHPQHTDAEWAAGTPFGGRVAHGMLVLSYAVGLVPIDPDRVVALRRIEDAVFKRPVRIGDTIRVEAKLARPDEGRGLEGWEWRVLNQKDELVARVKVEAVVRREADEADAEPGDPGDVQAAGQDSDGRATQVLI
ncbi:MAG TPA: MaoC/PaaZ C-terminal domain-containing protein [Thermoleophilaceae bacterium]|nr:MaoC/PaaZ C-terminal domain-containing protein [Thermoleophilaceae bacterium]